MRFDTHAAVKALTGADEPLAAAVVAVAQDASANIGQALATRADVADLRTDLAALEARLAWRLITAGIAIAGIAVAAGVALTAAVLRFVP